MHRSELRPRDPDVEALPHQALQLVHAQRPEGHLFVRTRIEAGREAERIVRIVVAP